jgi:hypothetical protein
VLALVQAGPTVLNRADRGARSHRLRRAISSATMPAARTSRS